LAFHVTPAKGAGPSKARFNIACTRKKSTSLHLAWHDGRRIYPMRDHLQVYLRAHAYIHTMLTRPNILNGVCVRACLVLHCWVFARPLSSPDPRPRRGQKAPPQRLRRSRPARSPTGEGKGSERESAAATKALTDSTVMTCATVASPILLSF
jgi:hypothetical protein